MRRNDIHRTALRCIGLLVVIAVSTAWAFPTTAAPARLDTAEIVHLAGLRQLDGRRLDPNRLAGRAVLVSFFSSWCKPCNVEFEHMKLLHLAHAANGLEIVAVNLSENAAGFEDDGERLERFLGRHAPIFPVVEGTDETAKRFGNVGHLPTVFVFDREGRAILHFVPEKDAQITGPGLGVLRRAVSDALGIGAADRRDDGSESLPVSTVSATKSSYFKHLSESLR